MLFYHLQGKCNTLLSAKGSWHLWFTHFNVLMCIWSLAGLGEVKIRVNWAWMCKVEYRMLWIAKSLRYGMEMDFNFHFRHTVFTLGLFPASMFSAGNGHVNYYWNSAVTHNCFLDSLHDTEWLVGENTLLHCLGTKMALGEIYPELP